MNYFAIINLFFLTNITIWSYTNLHIVNFQYIHLHCCNKEYYKEQNNKNNKNNKNNNKKLNYKNKQNSDAAMIPLKSIPKNKKWLEEIPNNYNSNIKDTQYLPQYILRKNISLII